MYGTSPCCSLLKVCPQQDESLSENRSVLIWHGHPHSNVSLALSKFALPPKTKLTSLITFLQPLSYKSESKQTRFSFILAWRTVYYFNYFRLAHLRMQCFTRGQSMRGMLSLLLSSVVWWLRSKGDYCCYIFCHMVFHFCFLFSFLFDWDAYHERKAIKIAPAAEVMDDRGMN